MGIKKNIAVIAETLAAKPSRLQAAAMAEQAERLLQDNEVRPSTRKPKKGVQAAQGRTRVERSKRFEAETVEEILSWGYVQPDGTVTAHCDSFTVGVVVDSGAGVESPHLPRYYFHYVDGGRNYRVIRK